MTRRNDLEICVEILRIARTGAKKTHIVYKANLNFRYVEKYLKTMIDNGFLKVEERNFITTPKGINFLNQYGTLVVPITEDVKEIAA